MQYTIRNPNTNATALFTRFNNEFPAGMSVSAPLLYSTSPECGSPTFAPAVGDTSIAFHDATILGGDDCVINLNVTVADHGVYVNTTEPVQAHYSGYGNAASATLKVGSSVYLPVVAR